MTADQLEAALSQFTGSENLYAHSSRQFSYTDGVKFLADNAGAYWLIDLIASYQKRCRKDAMLREIQIWELKKTGARTARVGCLRDSHDPVFAQDIPFTDFPLQTITLYLENEVLTLPRER